MALHKNFPNLPHLSSIQQIAGFRQCDRALLPPQAIAP